MYTLLNKEEVAQAYAKTLAESEDPDKRRDALVVLTFYTNVKYNDWDNDTDDNDTDDDDNDDSGNDNDSDNDDNDDGDESQLDVLYKLIESALLHDPDAEVRMYAAWAIGCLGNTETDVENLIHGLNDEDYRVRMETVQSLGFLGRRNSHGTVNGLLQALADKDLAVRMYALKSLLNSHSDAVLKQIKKLLDSVNADNSPTLLG